VFGEIYSRSRDNQAIHSAPSLRHNNGMLYTAKGTAALLVPLASIVAARYGWQSVFVIAVMLSTPPQALWRCCDQTDAGAPFPWP